MPQAANYSPVISLISSVRLGSYRTTFRSANECELYGIYIWSQHEDALCRYIPSVFNPPSTDERKKLVTIPKTAGLTLTTTIHLLYYLTQVQIPLTAFDLLQQVNLPLSTIHRNLSTFADFGLVDFIVDHSGACR